MARYERLVLVTYHGWDGNEMKLGAPCGNTWEYDQESAIAGLLVNMLSDDKKRCEYVPKTKRQFEMPVAWRRDLKLIIRCNFTVKNSHINGKYNQEIGDAFPSWTWRGDGEPTLVLAKAHSLSPAEVTAKDIFRCLCFLV